MRSPDIIAAIEPVVKAFEKLGVLYYIGGSVASSAYGIARATMEFYLVSPEDIIINKLEWYHMGGEVSETQWRDVTGVLKVQGDLLDVKYLRHWASQLKLTDLLEEAFHDAGFE